MESGIGKARNHDLIELCFGVGLSVERTAWVCGESLSRVWHEWSVRTGLPTPADPSPSAIRRMTRELRRGWDEDMKILARHGITARPSSKTIAYRNQARLAAQKRYWATRIAKREQTKCHCGSIDEKDSPSPSQVSVTQMTLSFECIPSGATA